MKIAKIIIYSLSISFLTICLFYKEYTAIITYISVVYIITELKNIFDELYKDIK